MAFTAADVIQGGALIILFAFVIAFTAYFRERDKRSQELTDRIVNRALDAMDAGVQAQQVVGEALGKLCITIDSEHEQRAQEHKAILQMIRGLDKRSLGRPENVGS
ncbi:MAG: hypothetical protein JW900_04450 [Anaerolineae bacterium]|nr:hypothetical protein [Anaerolineae bacterium]